MGKVKEYIKPFMPIYIFAIIIKAIGSVSDILIPLFMGKVIDEGIAKRDVNRIIYLCAFMLALTLVTVALNLWSNYLSAKATQSMGEGIRNNLYSQIQKLPIQEIDKLTTASLITRATNDADRVQQTLLMMARIIVRAPVMAVGGIILSLIIDPMLTAVVFVGMLLIGLISRVVYKKTRPFFRKVQISIDKLSLILRENLAGIKVIKSFNKSAHETKRFDAQSAEVKENEVAAGKVFTISGPSIGLVNGLTVAAVLFASLFRVRDAGIAVGEVGTVVNYVNQILFAMAMVPRIFMLFSRANASALRIGEVMEITSRTSFGEEEAPLDKETVLKGENLGFRYPGAAHNSLSNINFDIKQGETIGIIGGTGAGKSTLLNLILRLYEPSEGKLLLEGRPISQYKSDYLHSTVTAALQQYNIFAMSLGENISLNLETNTELLEDAVKTAQLTEVVKQVEGGFSYKIAQAGGNLSGGQKQRVNIARSLYRQAKLLVLDDVSSALDYRTDLKLRSAILEKQNGQSTVIISQRIASVRDAGRILVLDRGRSVGFDSHDNLVKSCPEYREICRTQGLELEDEKEYGAGTGGKLYEAKTAAR